MSTIHAYFIQCITNLHVGSGDANYGIIDKLVQRDTVLSYPTIHSSSLKGALRQHFEDAKYAEVEDIFGKKTNNDNDAKSGNCNFLNADLVALPIRCSHKQYALSFCQDIVEFANIKANKVGLSAIFNTLETTNKLFTNDNLSDVYLEDDTIAKTNFIDPFITKTKLISNQFAYLDNDIFKKYADDLPVIARNRLDENKNLWYEEVVPHQTIFITYIVSNTDNYASFETILLNSLIQVGANSSVGYGLCKFHKIEF